MINTAEAHPLNSSYEVEFFYNYLKKQNHLNIIDHVKEFTVKRNEYIYSPPFTDNFIYEIVSGAIKLGSYSESGEEYVYDVIQTGDFFGNLKYLNGQFFEYSKSLISSKIRIYDLSFFKKEVTENPRLAEWFISYLVKRWCISEKKLGKINERGTDEKLKYLIQSLNLLVYDSNKKEHLLFHLLTQKDLADLMGTTRQTISNLLKKLD
ncbi:Crp/Fnr family transcriptional regulator [Cellulophaga baltica]|uniref:Crp/Fnr family transcriptional regulator n=1 Tax=Cellulophaga baltica TaxID=76594 RepID=UPI002147B3A8|nr:Crp/Fnr family transcriptional regulator [Cellulophaga baltica]MCR1025664.1 Crp/Fnr family transcriptional regulator [Cellulophaga baltica]